MRAFVLICILSLMALTACSVAILSNEPTPGPLFLTATLPATHTPFPTLVTPSTTIVAPTLNATQAACKERAVVMQDVTVPDNTYMAPGAAFTKTWRFKNTGTCAWNGFTIAFASGDRMGAPDSAPVPTTAPNATVDVSVNLTAPTAYNAYAGYFVLNDPSGKPVPVGIFKNFWVKIMVGNVQVTSVASPAITLTPVVAHRPTSPGGCKYNPSVSYVGEVEDLINGARAKAGLGQLSENSQLAAAAQGHSVDMACHSLLSHTGSDTSTIYQRITAAGYNPVHYQEVIYAGGLPQDAFNSWMKDQVHHDAIMSTSVTELGGGYAYVSDSAYGGYFTVDFGSP